MQKELTIVLRHGFATFGSACLTALNNAEFLQMSVSGNEITFIPAKDGFPFFRETGERQLVLRAGREVVKAFETASGQTYDKKTGTKYQGQLVDGKLVFII